MAIDYWTDSVGFWDDPSNWSAGVPSAPSDVHIDQGAPVVRESFGIVAGITNSATLSFFTGGGFNAAVNLVTGNVGNSGTLDLDPYQNEGGSSLAIGGTLTNRGTINVGPYRLGSYGTLSAASTIAAVSLNNLGTINLFGSTTAEATLDIVSAAGFGVAGVLTGDVNVAYDALVEFASGQITAIAPHSELSLFGPHAFVADASDTSSNSALKGLSTVFGGLFLDNGANVTRTGALTNLGTITLDNLSGAGGSALTVGGTLTNAGTIQIGPSDSTLSVASALKAASIVNYGAINLYGHSGVGPNAILSSSGSVTNNGSVNLSDDVDKLAGSINGTGNFSLSNGSTLEFGAGVASGESVTFDGGAPDRLILDQASSFHGTVDDFFTPGDRVVAKTFAKSTTTFDYTQTSANSCAWTLINGSNIAVINFAGEPYTENDFRIVSANGGLGSAITFSPHLA
jgi:hypothetical protein